MKVIKLRLNLFIWTVKVFILVFNLFILSGQLIIVIKRRAL